MYRLIEWPGKKLLRLKYEGRSTYGMDKGREEVATGRGYVVSLMKGLGWFFFCAYIARYNYLISNHI